MRLQASPSTIAKISFVAALSALVLPAAALAQETVGVATSAPIEVATCRQNVTIAQQPSLGDIEVTTNSAHVRFVNRSSVAATDVVFQLRSGDDTQIVHDRGTFAPGVAISHNFTMRSGGTYFAGASTCNVVSAHFANGTAWRADGRSVVGLK